MPPNMVAEPVDFKLGKLRGFIDPESGQLRYLRIGPYELLRGIYGSVRRPDWGTVVPKIESFKLDKKRGSFVCTFEAIHKDDKMDFSWKGRIEGKLIEETHVEIEYEFEGTVPVEQKTNRLGLCLLHPASLKGIPVEIEHQKDACEMMSFPKLIKPDQPFKDTKAITYELTKGVGIRIELYGDGFETEDQRNYGDASYKTYCHPQEWGSPYVVKQGQVISQRAKLIISLGGYKDEEPTPVATEGYLPSLGTLFKRAISIPEMGKIMKLGLTHAQAATEGFEQAKLLGGPVFLQTQTASIPNSLSPDDGILFTSIGNWKNLNNVRGAKKLLAAQGWFIELNGVRPHFDEIDGAALGLQPKTHQFDTETMMECAWCIPDQAETARYIGAKTIVTGPVRLSDSPDKRTSGIEAALFTFASIANAVKAKVNYLTLFDAATLLESPAALPLTLISDRTSSHVRIWDFEPDFVMIECGKLILVNLSWEPSELFKKVEFDSKDNLQVGIKGEYHLFDKSNIERWKEVMEEPAKHSILDALPPRSIVVLG